MSKPLGLFAVGTEVDRALKSLRAFKNAHTALGLYNSDVNYSIGNYEEVLSSKAGDVVIESNSGLMFQNGLSRIGVFERKSFIAPEPKVSLDEKIVIGDGDKQKEITVGDFIKNHEVSKIKPISEIESYFNGSEKYKTIFSQKLQDGELDNKYEEISWEEIPLVEQFKIIDGIVDFKGVMIEKCIEVMPKQNIDLPSINSLSGEEKRIVSNINKLIPRELSALNLKDIFIQKAEKYSTKDDKKDSFDAWAGLEELVKKGIEIKERGSIEDKYSPYDASWTHWFEEVKSHRVSLDDNHKISEIPSIFTQKELDIDKLIYSIKANGLEDKFDISYAISPVKTIPRSKASLEFEVQVYKAKELDYKIESQLPIEKRIDNQIIKSRSVDMKRLENMSSGVSLR